MLVENGKSTNVKVTDRGSKLGNHKIDLSKNAANENRPQSQERRGSRQDQGYSFTGRRSEPHRHHGEQTALSKRYLDRYPRSSVKWLSNKSNP
jgi:hypothetical protein